MPASVQYPSTYHLIPAWGIAAVLLLLIVLALEAGFRHSRQPPRSVNLSALQGSLLGLASLLLAFSYSLTEARFDERRLLVVKEAAVLKVAYDRMGLMPQPVQTAMRTRLLKYLDLHIQAAQSFRSPGLTRELLRENDRLQDEMWDLLAGQKLEELHPTVLLLMTYGLNDLVTTSAQRLASSQTRLPSLVLYLLVTAVVASSFLVGYQPGQEKRNVIHWGIFAAVMVMVMFTLFDLDRPSAGIIRTSIEPLITLKDFIEARH